MDRHTGRAIGADAHLAQSITDILSTPTGSLVMERTYGSDLPDLIDQPLNGASMVDVFVATAEALDRWEPRMTVTRVRITASAAGRAELDIAADVGGLPRTIPVTVALDAPRRALAGAGPR